MTSGIASRLRDLLDGHPRAITAGVIGGALVLVAAAVVLAIGTFNPPPTADASPTPSPLVSPSASVIPSASPTGSASPAPASAEPTAAPAPTVALEVPDGLLPPFSRAIVVVDALQLRDQPGLAAGAVGTLPIDTVVEVAGWQGPVSVDDLEWYPVLSSERQFGWVAVGRQEDRYLELLPPRCPVAEPDLTALTSMTDWEQVACFGDRSLILVGTYGCPVCGSYIPGTYEPGWLAHPSNLNYIGWPDVLTLHFPPEAGIDAPPNASIVRVVGHFNDPIATTCTMSSPSDLTGINSVIAELYCRERFVVDSYEIIGTDPDFT